MTKAEKIQRYAQGGASAEYISKYFTVPIKLVYIIIAKDQAGDHLVNFKTKWYQYLRNKLDII